MIRQDKAYRKMLGDWLDNDEVRESVNAIPDPPVGAKGMPKFMELLRNVDEGSPLETAYGNLSLAAHVRPSSQASYFHVADGQLQVRRTPEHHFRFPSTDAAAMAAMLAVAIVMELANDRDALERIGIASDRLALPVTLRPGIQSKNRRTGPGVGTPWAISAVARRRLF